MEDQTNQFYVYCYAADGVTKQYVYNGGNNSLSFTDAANKTAFTVTQNSGGTFKLNNGAWYWNMQGGASGTRFCSYNNANDNNNNVYFWYHVAVDGDPYDLDGKAAAVFGTHTHVPTADARVLPKGTGYVTDLGMTGPAESVLGIRPEQSIALFRGELTKRFEPADGKRVLQSVLFTIDGKTNRCKAAERLDLYD